MEIFCCAVVGVRTGRLCLSALGLWEGKEVFTVVHWYNLQPLHSAPAHNWGTFDLGSISLGGSCLCELFFYSFIFLFYLWLTHPNNFLFFFSSISFPQLRRYPPHFVYHIPTFFCFFIFLIVLFVFILKLFLYPPYLLFHSFLHFFFPTWSSFFSSLIYFIPFFFFWWFLHIFLFNI